MQRRRRVKSVSLEPPDQSMRVALAEVGVGDTVIRVAVRRSRSGHLHVAWPTWDEGESLRSAVEPPVYLQLKLEREVLAAYQEAETRSGTSTDPSDCWLEWED